MEVLKEVTEWAVDYRQPNHVYLFKGEKILAYQKWGEGEPIYFDRPGKLDKRGRKFIKVDVSPFKNLDDRQSTLVEVKSSTGGTYYVDPDAKTCTCPGFRFRGQCKHLTSN